MIDTDVPGSPTAVDTVTTWLRDSLKKKVDAAADEVTQARRLAEDAWEGESGNAYVRCARDVVTVTDDHVTRIDRAVGKFEAYSDRLRSLEERMSEIRGEARGGGLSVEGTFIHPPGDLTDQDEVELYNRLVTDVGDEWTRFQEWIEANLTPVEAQLDASATEKALEELKGAAANFGIALSLESGKRGLSGKAKDLDARARELHRWRRSGNPARRAAHAEASRTGAIDDLAEQGRWLNRASRVLGPLGTVYEGYVALESDTPAGGLIAVAGGVAATAVVIATAPVSVPAAAVVLGATAVGVGVSWAIGEGWDALPDDLTDPVDDFVEDAWSDTKDAVGDGWDTVKGWF